MVTGNDAPFTSLHNVCILLLLLLRLKAYVVFFSILKHTHFIESVELKMGKEISCLAED